MPIKNKKELVRQIEAYGLKNKLADLAKRQEARRPFKHLPKQFSKGILIGNIAIVPKKHTGTRYVYVVADMLEAKILHEDINLKQTAILVAHHLADGKAVPQNLVDYDTHFSSKLFEIQAAKIRIKQAKKEKITKWRRYIANVWMMQTITPTNTSQKYRTFSTQPLEYKY